MRRKMNMRLKLCPLIEYYIRNIFMEKSCRKCAPKASPRRLFLFWWTIEIFIACNKLKYFERGLSKTFKKVNFYFFFQTQSLLMNKVIKNKRGLKLVSCHSSGYKTSSQKFLYWLHIIWPNGIMQSAFWVIPNIIYTFKFMQANSWHHN